MWLVIIIIVEWFLYGNIWSKGFGGKSIFTSEVYTVFKVEYFLYIIQIMLQYTASFNKVCFTLRLQGCFLSMYKTKYHASVGGGTSRNYALGGSFKCVTLWTPRRWLYTRLRCYLFQNVTIKRELTLHIFMTFTHMHISNVLKAFDKLYVNAMITHK